MLLFIGHHDCGVRTEDFTITPVCTATLSLLIHLEGHLSAARCDTLVYHLEY